MRPFSQNLLETVRHPLLTALVDTSDDAIVSMTLDGIITSWNPAAQSLYGWSSRDVLGEYLTILSPAHSAEIETLLRRISKGERVSNYETTRIRFDGTAVEVSLSVSPIHDVEDRIIGAVESARDVTEKKLAQETQARDAQILANVRDAVVVTDLQGVVTYWNEGATKLFGWTAREMIGRRYTDRFDEAALSSFMKRCESDWIGEVADRRKDGTAIWIESHVSRIHECNGKPVGIMLLAHDVSERRRATETVRMRDRAIHAVRQGILITDPRQRDNPIVYASAGFERLTGYRADEVQGRNPRFLQGPESDPAVVAQVRDAVAQGRSCSVEIINYRKDGSTFWNALHLTPVYESEKLIHYVGVQIDVTEKRSLEEQLRQVQKMDAIGQLAGGVAHDFNNLLTVINGYSSVLLQRLPPDDPMVEMIHEIRKAGEHSASLTRQLLAFSRKQSLSPRILDLNSIVADVQKMLCRLLGPDIELHTVLEPILQCVKADPGQLEQVLLNLSVNARDAMPQGGKLTIETKNVQLASGRYVLLAVTDSGVGMTKEIADRIFEPFFTTKGPERGTGLGLSVVYGVVKQSGGDIEVVTEPDVGTTFKIFLPSIEAGAAGRTSARMPVVLPRGCETVLVVEDEEAVRTLTCRLLRDCGYHVLDAAHARAAEQIAAEYAGAIELLITDIVMPGMNGVELAKRLTSKYPAMKSLLLSGYVDAKIKDEMNFVQKPFSPAVLAQSVRDLLDRPAGVASRN